MKSINFNVIITWKKDTKKMPTRCQKHAKVGIFQKIKGSFQNASIEIKQISFFSFFYQENRFTVKKLICKMQNENSLTDKRFF